MLREGTQVAADWQRKYFTRGTVHFPHYRQSYVAGSSYLSPFGFFFGINAPYLDISVGRAFPPEVVFVDEPIYNGASFSGFANVGNQNLMDDPNLDRNEPGLNAALDELTETFQGGNIDGLVALIDPNTSIAVYLRGQYQYSLSSSDYVDLARDAIQSTQTIKFELQYLHERTPGVFAVSGQQVYRGHEGRNRTVFVSYVLQDIGGQWTLTQVETTPDVNQNIWGQ